jgi:hypothetical protein
MVFYMGSMPRDYKRAQSEDATEYRTVVKSSRVKSLELAVEGDREEMARKETDCDKKISCVI